MTPSDVAEWHESLYCNLLPRGAAERAKLHLDSSKCIRALIAENAVLGERLETARIAREAHNRQYAEAERKLAEAEGLLEPFAAEADRQDQSRSYRDGAVQVVDCRIPIGLFRQARTFLSSKDAERG